MFSQEILLSKPLERAGVVIEGETGRVEINSTKSFVTIHARPIKPTRDESPFRVASPQEQLTSIIIQGPVIEEHDFTRETINLYERLFPETPIILSTWDDTPIDLLRSIETTSAVLVLSRKPPKPGWGHVDYQIASVNAAVEQARVLGSTHVVKSRTDFRMMRGDSLVGLHALQAMVPLKSGGTQQERLLATDLATLKHRPYGLTDIFQFGQIDDMALYWKPGEFEAEVKSLTSEFGSPPLVSGIPLVSEIFLCWRYLRSLGHSLDFSLGDWWMHLGERFGIIDVSSLDAFWFRHDWNWEYRFGHSYTQRGPLNVSHIDWITLVQFGVPKSWTVNDFRERWTHSYAAGAPTSEGIFQVSV